MNLLIAGSRDIDLPTAFDAIEVAYWTLDGLAPAFLISGDARGVDQHGQRWWHDVLGEGDCLEEDGSIKHYPADWDNLGKRAGYVRNMEMAAVADQAIIVWDGQSRGTNHMMNLLDAAEVETVIVTWDPRTRKRQVEHRRYA
jgi:hypothetical protein